VGEHRIDSHAVKILYVILCHNSTKLAVLSFGPALTEVRGVKNVKVVQGLCLDFFPIPYHRRKKLSRKNKKR